jgi:outer membrane protein TolC
VDGGVATETDLLEFQMHQQEKRNDLESLEQQLQNQYRDLERFSGSKEKILRLQEIAVKLKKIQTFDEIWSRVKEKNINLRRARSDVAAARAEKASAVGGYLPKISAEAQYGKLYETDFVESRKNSWAVVGKITVPIFNGFSDFNHLEAKSYEVEKSLIAESQTEMKLRDMTQNLIETVERLEKKLDGEQKNQQTAQRYYQAVVGEYKRGVKNSPDMAGATDKLFEAKLRVLEADCDLSIATIELLSIQGLSIQDQ